MEFNQRFILLTSLITHKLQNMKKLGFLLVLGGVFISSCKKDYVCTCKDSANGGTSYSSTLYNMTQTQAATLCAGGQGNATTTCKI